MLGLLLGHLYFVEVAIDLLCSADGIEVGTLDKMKKFKRVKLWQAMDDLHLLFWFFELPLECMQVQNQMNSNVIQ